jgi:Na+/H+ antiporter NhaD/arsenite permease-like protein
MNLAWLSLGSLLFAIIISCFTQLNVGVVAVAFAWIVGVYFGSMRLEEVLSGFPIQLFLTLAGVTLLFTQAQLNGTLDKIAHRSVRLCRGNTGLIPITFFLLGAAIASLGPGNIATAAMLAPMAMAIASRARIPAFLMAIMVGNGAQSGGLSPFAPTGIIVTGLMAKIGLGGHEWHTYWTNLVAHAAVAFAGYFAFGGWKLFRAEYASTADAITSSPPFDVKNWTTIGVLTGMMASVMLLGANIGMAAFAGAAILAAVRVADHEQAIRRMPWAPILMVSGVTILIALLEKTGGLDLFTAMLARTATRETVTGAVAFVTAIISVYSSTSGVVLPAFLPTIPGLVARLGGGDPISIATSMNVGAHLVDMSPLSTTGAMCLAGITDPAEVRPTYNKMLAWGMSMSVVGALLCWIFF